MGTYEVTYSRVGATVSVEAEGAAQAIAAAELPDGATAESVERVPAGDEAPDTDPWVWSVLGRCEVCRRHLLDGDVYVEDSEGVKTCAECPVTDPERPVCRRGGEPRDGPNRFVELRLCAETAVAVRVMGRVRVRRHDGVLAVARERDVGRVVDCGKSKLPRAIVTGPVAVRAFLVNLGVDDEDGELERAIVSEIHGCATDEELATFSDDESIVGEPETSEVAYDAETGDPVPLSQPPNPVYLGPFDLGPGVDGPPPGCVCHETVHGKSGCPVHGPHPAFTPVIGRADPTVGEAIRAGMLDLDAPDPAKAAGCLHPWHFNPSIMKGASCPDCGEADRVLSRGVVPPGVSKPRFAFAPRLYAELIPPTRRWPPNPFDSAARAYEEWAAGLAEQEPVPVVEQTTGAPLGFATLVSREPVVEPSCAQSDCVRDPGHAGVHCVQPKLAAELDALALDEPFPKVPPRTYFPGDRCASCDSPDPGRHPAVQHGGEVSPCPDHFHDAAEVSPEVKTLIDRARRRSPTREALVAQRDNLHAGLNELGVQFRAERARVRELAAQVSRLRDLRVVDRRTIERRAEVELRRVLREVYWSIGDSSFRDLVERTLGHKVLSRRNADGELIGEPLEGGA